MSVVLALAVFAIARAAPWNDSQASGGTVTACATSITVDTDDDQFPDCTEKYLGTDPNARCGVDAWPADIDNDTFVDTGDIAMLTAWFGQAVPPAPARVNIGPDPPDGFVDTADIARLTGLFGRSCAP